MPVQTTQKSNGAASPQEKPGTAKMRGPVLRTTFVAAIFALMAMVFVPCIIYAPPKRVEIKREYRPVFWIEPHTQVNVPHLLVNVAFAALAGAIAANLSRRGWFSVGAAAVVGAGVAGAMIVQHSQRERDAEVRKAAERQINERQQAIVRAKSDEWYSQQLQAKGDIALAIDKMKSAAANWRIANRPDDERRVREKVPTVRDFFDQLLDDPVVSPAPAAQRRASNTGITTATSEEVKRAEPVRSPPSLAPVSAPQSGAAIAAKEFAEGRKTKFSTKGHAKAKGVALTISHPNSWRAMEGERPNIVQKFVSEGGRGLEMAIMITTPLPLPAGAKVSEEELRQTFTPDHMKGMVPLGARFIDAKPTKIEGQPAGVLEYALREDRAGLTVEMQVMAYIFVQASTMVQLQCSVGVPPSAPGSVGERMGEYKPIFSLMANSIVIESLWP